MSDGLTPLSCPFCGGAEISQGEVLTSMGDGGTATQSMCYGCGALGPEARLPEGEVDYGDVRSTEAWNRRAAPSSPVADDGLPEPVAAFAPNGRTVKWDVNYAKEPWASAGYTRLYTADQVRQAQREAYEAGIKAAKENR